MSLKKLFLTTSAAALITGQALADGGPNPDAPPPPPPPPEARPYAPPPAVEPAPRIWYAGIHGGAVWPDDITLDSFAQTFITDMGTGWAGGAALGYRYDSGFRFEFEGTWRDNDGDVIEVGFPGVSPARISAVNAMLNGIFDFDTGSFFTPYLGAGIGVARVSMEFDFPLVTREDDGWAFAYQGIGGFTVPVPNTAVDLFADYRYLRTEGLALFDGLVQAHDQYVTHTVMGGVLFNF